MRRRSVMLWTIVAILAVVGFGTGDALSAEESPQQAGEKVGIEGQFVRVATNDEGWVVLGYRIANESVGEEWMLLEVGMTVQRGSKEQQIERDDVALVTADGKTIPLATQEEYMKATLQALDARADMVRDSIDYFPAGVSQPCRIGFFGDASRRVGSLAHDQVSLSSQTGCLGRLYFRVPGGIQYGGYNLDVRFENSIVRVPFKIMTKEEAKEFAQKWKEMRKEQKQERKQAKD